MTFEQFVTARAPVMLRTATFLSGGDLGLAEDLVQEVLIKVHRRWDRIGALEGRDSFVRRMLVNEFLSWRRKWARIVPFADIEMPDLGADHPSVDADQRMLRAELARLSPRRRVVLVLRYYAGLSDAEIADAMGCQVSTVRSLATRALTALRINPALRAEFSAHVIPATKGPV